MNMSALFEYKRGKKSKKSMEETAFAVGHEWRVVIFHKSREETTDMNSLVSTALKHIS